jgi:hypothetical protein
VNTLAAESIPTRSRTHTIPDPHEPGPARSRTRARGPSGVREADSAIAVRPGRTIVAVGSKTWILTGSPANFAVTRELGFSVIGFKERRRRQALEMEIGDRIVFYLTQVSAFPASVLVSGELFEDREPVWPGKPGSPDQYPWRIATQPELILEETDWIAAESMVDKLEHIGKWPRDHWKLAFQGQLRTVSPADAAVLVDRLALAGAVRA